MIVVVHRMTQDHFSKVSIYNFSGLKKYKKGYIEMTKKIYLDTFDKCPGLVSFSLLSLLMSEVKQENTKEQVSVFN